MPYPTRAKTIVRSLALALPLLCIRSAQADVTLAPHNFFSGACHTLPVIDLFSLDKFGLGRSISGQRIRITSTALDV